MNDPKVYQALFDTTAAMKYLGVKKAFWYAVVRNEMIEMGIRPRRFSGSSKPMFRREDLDRLIDNLPTCKD